MQSKSASSFLDCCGNYLHSANGTTLRFIGATLPLRRFQRSKNLPLATNRCGHRRKLHSFSDSQTGCGKNQGWLLQEPRKMLQSCHTRSLNVASSLQQRWLQATEASELTTVLSRASACTIRFGALKVCYDPRPKQISSLINSRHMSPIFHDARLANPVLKCAQIIHE